MEIKFIKFDENVEMPYRAHPHDTGADIIMSQGGRLFASQTRTIPLGFGIEIPNGHTARLQVRTSIAKRGVMVQGCAIDAGYTGEIHMIIHNISKEVFEWSAGDRLCYIEVYPTQYPTFVLEERCRGKYGIGSTGR